IFYLELDNLGEVTAREEYDGDGVTISDADNDGVPDKPSASLLRARTTASYDDQRRVYQSQTFSVNQSTGSISTNALTAAVWRDHRGQVIKTAQPGGLVTKMQYDGARRSVKTFTTDGGGDSSWSDAGNVTGDAVLTQTEYQYDASGLVLLTITR